MECLIGKLPWILEWLNWNLYAYNHSLIFCVIMSVVYYSYWLDLYAKTLFWDWVCIFLSLFVGFCAWVVYCAIKYGFATG